MWEALRTLELNPPATSAEIKEAECAIGQTLPDQYIEFIKTANGGEGPIGKEGYLQLWSVSDLKPLNDAYEIAEFAPGLLLFGSNGGGTGYAFDERDAMEVVDVPFIGLSRSETRKIGASFAAFLDQLARE